MAGGSSSAGGCCIQVGDRVALVYPNNDPISFLVAFYGCLTAGVVPVPIEVPLTKRDAGSQGIGFFLGSCNISVALTSEACLKGEAFVLLKCYRNRSVRLIFVAIETYL